VAGEKRADLPPEVDEVIAKGMAKSRDDRFGTPRELAVALREASGIPSTSVGATQLSAGAGAGAETVLAGTAAGGSPPEHPEAAPPATAPPAPPAPAAPAPAAPAPPPRPGMSRQTKLIAAGVIGALLVAGAIIGTVLAVTGGGKKTTTTSTGATGPSALVTDLIASDISKYCTTQSAPATGAILTVKCTPASSAPTSFPNEFSLSFYREASSLETAYENAKKGVTIGNCGNGAGEKDWIHPATGKRGGKRFCYTQGNEFVIVWTHEKLGADDHVNMLGIAKEPGRSPTIVAGWWNFWRNHLGKCGDNNIPEDVCLNTVKKFS
jgi:hypothetical protein